MAADDDAQASGDTHAWDALHSRLDDVQDQVTALARHGASDAAVESLRAYAEGLAARVTQLERRLP